MGTIALRLRWLERQVGLASAAKAPTYAVVAQDAEGRVRRLLVTGPQRG